MGIQSFLARKKEERKESKRASEVYKKIITPRIEAARRRAYEKESLKQAEIRGAELAKRKASRLTFGERARTITRATTQVARGGTRLILKKPRKSSPLRRKKRRTYYYAQPKRRRTRRAVSQPAPRQAQAQPSQQVQPLPKVVGFEGFS